MVKFFESKNYNTRSNITILSEIFWYMKYTGYRPDLYPSFSYKLVFYLTLFLNSWYVLTTFWRFTLSYSDLEIATETLATIATGILVVFKITIFYRKREKLIKLMNDFQANVDKCKLKSYNQIFAYYI